jgi:glucan-binding YG repeat protein
MMKRRLRKFEEGGVTSDDLEKANASEDPIYTLNKLKGFTDTDDSGPSRSAAPTPKSMSFKEAFASARKGGDKSFEWQGKKYTTELAKPKAAAPAPKAAAPTPKAAAPAPAPKPKYETPYDRMNRQNREAAATKKSAADTERATLRENIRKGMSGDTNAKTLLPMKKGGMTASKRADGIAIRGKTRA